MFSAIIERRVAILRAAHLSIPQAGPSRYFGRSIACSDDHPSSSNPAYDSEHPTNSTSASDTPSSAAASSSSSLLSALEKTAAEDTPRTSMFSTRPNTEHASSSTSTFSSIDQEFDDIMNKLIAEDSKTGDSSSGPDALNPGALNSQQRPVHDDTSPGSFGASVIPSEMSGADEELRSLEKLFGKFKPGSSFNQTESSTSEWSPEALDALRGPKWNTDRHVVSPRKRSPTSRVLRGVHDKQRRKLGQTPHEAKAFDEVLAGIFADLERHGSHIGRSSNPQTDPFGNDASGQGVDPWRRSLRKTSSSFISDRSETTPKDEVLEELDRLKEEMSAMSTDTELLEWAEKSVFKPQRVEEDGHPVYSEAYPHILTQLLRTARTNFNNPNLALALFQHAQTISLESYMAGCLTGAYNELIAIRWDSFKDLEGVEAAAREMDSNGVGWDRKTRSLIAKVCEQVTAGILGSRKLGAWGDSAEQRLKALEARVENDIQREQEISESKKREARNRARAPFKAGRFGLNERPFGSSEDEFHHEERMRASA